MPGVKNPEVREANRLLWRDTSAYQQRDPRPLTSVRITTEERNRRREMRKSCWKEARKYAMEEDELARLVGRDNNWQETLRTKYEELLIEHEIKTESDRLREYALTMPNQEPKATPPLPPAIKPHRVRALEVGESLFIEGPPNRKTIAYKIAKELGRTFTTRKCVEQGCVGTRIWRLT